MYGLNIDPMNPKGNPPGAELKALGVKMARYSYIDRSAGPALDAVQVAFYQDRVREYFNAGIDSLLILTYDTLPGKPPFDASMPEWESYIERFVYRVEQIASIFGPARCALQIWNEPDLASSPAYDPALRPEVYAKMLDRACQVILKASYHTAIVSAGLASGNPDWWAKVYMGTIQPIDVLAIHPYGQRPTPDFPHPGWGFGYVGDLIERYQAVWGGKIWITEIGKSTTNEEEQAAYLTKFYDTIHLSYRPPVEFVYWFCYHDGMVSPYGLVDGASVRKPAYNSYQVSAVTG